MGLVWLLKKFPRCLRIELPPPAWSASCGPFFFTSNFSVILWLISFIQVLRYTESTGFITVASRCSYMGSLFLYSSHRTFVWRIWKKSCLLLTQALQCSMECTIRSTLRNISYRSSLTMVKCPYLYWRWLISCRVVGYLDSAFAML